MVGCVVGSLEQMEPESERDSYLDDCRLRVLSEYADSNGLVSMVIMVSHNGLFAGDVHRFPVCSMTAGLVEKGFIDLYLQDDEDDEQP